MKRVPSFSGRPGFPQGLKVLLVAADEQARDGVAAQLKDCEYSVTACSSVGNACESLACNSYDIVLAEAGDLRAGKGDAQLLVKGKGQVPLILMSESEAPGEVLQGIHLGAVDFLKRPLSPLKLRNIWQHTVRRMMIDVGGGETGRESDPVSAPGTPSPKAFPGNGAGGSGVSGSSSAGILGNGSEGEATSEQETMRMESRAVETSERRRLRKTVTRDNENSVVNRPPLAMKPPAFSMPPLMGIPPGCIPEVGTNGIAIGMPVFNQPPFTPPSPGPFNLIPPVNPGGVPCVPGQLPFLGYPMVTPPMGVGPQPIFGNISGAVASIVGNGGAGGSGIVGNTVASCSRENLGIAAGGGSSSVEGQTWSMQTAGPMLIDEALEADYAPLGLSLKKSPSLINMISKSLGNVEVQV